MKKNVKPLPLEGMPILSAKEMARIEKMAIEEDASLDEFFMDNAARGIFHLAKDLMSQKNLPHKVSLFCGKGNNAGDAYSVGVMLLENNIAVEAYQFFPLEDCSKLCQKQAKNFQKHGGILHFPENIREMALYDSTHLVLDGMLGTGFVGQLEGKLLEATQLLNQESHFVLSIDIPSGMNGSTGVVEKDAVLANATAYLGTLKIGHIYNQGLEYSGDLYFIDFGLAEKYKNQAEVFAYLINTEIAHHNIFLPCRRAHKYEVGQVLIVAGSQEMPGAAMLTSNACLKTGAGMIKLYSTQQAIEKMYGVFPEVIKIVYDEQLVVVREELSRSKAMILGPGLGRSAEIKDIVKKSLSFPIPKVVDGDALYFITEMIPPKGTILTPHEGELCRLLQIKEPMDQLELLEKAQEYVNQYDVVLVYKGAPTTILAKDKPKLVLPFGNQGMAKAGMGDVLSGMIGAFLLSHDSREAAALGVFCHQKAGDRVGEKKSLHSLIASDVIEELSSLFHDIERYDYE